MVVGVPPKMEGAIDLPLAKRPGARDRETMQVDHEEGQKALTHFRVIDRAGNRAALLALWPRTGRTHQLRVHCAEIGCPILGDRKYGGEEALLSAVADSRRLHLHARRLTLPHPSGKGTLRVRRAPAHFKRTLDAFGFSTAGERERLGSAFPGDGSLAEVALPVLAIGGRDLARHARPVALPGQADRTDPQGHRPRAEGERAAGGQARPRSRAGGGGPDAQQRRLGVAARPRQGAAHHDVSRSLLAVPGRGEGRKVVLEGADIQVEHNEAGDTNLEMLPPPDGSGPHAGENHSLPGPPIRLSRGSTPSRCATRR